MPFSDVAKYGEFCEYRQAFFWAKVDKSEDCWLWTAAIHEYTGYGIFNLSKPKVTAAHRYSYETEYGPIPDGLVIDHKCHVRACVRPSHLQAVTQKQNMENQTGARPWSKSGVRGVTWHLGKWRASVTHHGKHHHFGRYDDIKDAEAAVIAGQAKLFTHQDTYKDFLAQSNAN